MWMTTAGYPDEGTRAMVLAIVATVLPVELVVIVNDFQILIIDTVVRVVSA